MERKHRSLLYWIIVSIGLVGIILYRSLVDPLQFDADLLNLLELDEQPVEVTRSATQPYQNRALLMLSNADRRQVITQIRSIQSALAQQDWIGEASVNPSAQFDLQQLAQTYTKYPLALMSQPAIAARDDNNYQYFNQRFLHLMSQPANPMVAMTIEQAPLLNVADWLSEQLKPGQWQQDGDLLYVSQGEHRYYPLFIQFKPTATTLDNVVDVAAQLQKIVQHAVQGSETEVLKSGLIFHSAAITEQAEFEMGLFGGLSILGVLLLSLLYFRSVLPIVWILVLIGGSGLAGLAALSLVFSKIHLLTLVFSISLIGIAVDYGYHVILAAQFSGKSGKALVAYIAPALLMGGGTTLLSYLLLLLLPIPFLRQVAVFVCAGLAFAIFTSLALLAWWPGQRYRQTGGIPRTWHKTWYWALTGGLVAICLLALSQWHFEDNIKQFNSTPQTLLDSEIRVSQLIGNRQYPRFLAISADSEQLLVERLEAIRQQFNQAPLNQYELSGIDQWLPSLTTQKMNSEWLRQSIADNQFQTALSYTSEQNIEQLLKSPSSGLVYSQLPQQIRGLYPPLLKHHGEVSTVISYLGPITASTVNNMQQQLGFAIQLVDQPGQLSEALMTLRTYVMYFLAVSAMTLIVLMLFRYGVSGGLDTALIPVLSATGGLALTQILIGYVSLFNLLACILILALVVDYAVFLREHGRCQHVLRAISLSALTSCLAFGMLVLSQTPAIWQFGLTVLLGISVGWALCLFAPARVVKEHND
ncbi:MMPL family transporter [Neptunicella sp. SCSIO 80796]|uniref:MMPL family transporter n=1 Tax=Neptunicella plasticusilytica TaxID=3117012 RepID=UPI003A4D4A47